MGRGQNETSILYGDNGPRGQEYTGDVITTKPITQPGVLGHYDQYGDLIRVSTTVDEGGSEILVMPDGTIKIIYWDNEYDADAEYVFSGIGDFYLKNDKLHREDGPAIDMEGSSKYYYQHGQKHREDGPAVFVPEDELEEWYDHGQKHREDGPAVIWAGDQEYWQHGQPHREDGPAVIYNSGAEEYWRNGKQVDD